MCIGTPLINETFPKRALTTSDLSKNIRKIGDYLVKKKPFIYIELFCINVEKERVNYYTYIDKPFYEHKHE